MSPCKQGGPALPHFPHPRSGTHTSSYLRAAARVQQADHGKKTQNGAWSVVNAHVLASAAAAAAVIGVQCVSIKERRETAKAISTAQFQCLLSPRKMKSENVTRSVVSDPL